MSAAVARPDDVAVGVEGLLLVSSVYLLGGSSQRSVVTCHTVLQVKKQRHRFVGCLALFGGGVLSGLTLPLYRM